MAAVCLPAAGANAITVVAAAGLLGFVVFIEVPINQKAVSKHVPAGARLVVRLHIHCGFDVRALDATLAGVVLTRATPAALFGLLVGLALPRPGSRRSSPGRPRGAASRRTTDRLEPVTSAATIDRY